MRWVCASNRYYSGCDPPPLYNRKFVQVRGRCGFVTLMLSSQWGARGCGPGGGRRGQFLTRGRAPQRGITPLWAAAHMGNLEVVQVLVQADANKEAPDQVREGS